jgi:stress-induced morphogen
VSDAFNGLSRLVQHRVVYGIFGDQVVGGIHALSIKSEPRK